MRGNLTVSVIDQACISGFNFALNLYLIKLWSPEEFGIFAIVSAVAILMAMLQNALINTPLAVHLPIVASEPDKALLLRVFTASNAVLTMLLLCLGTGGMVMWLDASQVSLAISSALFIASQFAREYYRALLAVEGRMRALLIVDVAFVLLSAISLAAFHFMGDDSLQTVPVLLFVLSGWGTASVVFFMWPRTLPALGKLPGEVRSVFASQKHEIRWSLLGVITTDIQNRGYLFVAAAVFGPATVAHLQAGRIFFGPLNLLTSAWSRVARPQLARHLGSGEVGQFRAVLLQALGAFVAFNVVFLMGLFLAWPYLSALVFEGKYDDLGYVVAGWGLANLVFQVRSCMGIGVQAMRRFRELTLSTIYGAIASTLLVGLACAVYQPSWLIASVIAGECVAIVVILNIFKVFLPTGVSDAR